MRQEWLNIWMDLAEYARDHSTSSVLPIFHNMGNAELVLLSLAYSARSIQIFSHSCLITFKASLVSYHRLYQSCRVWYTPPPPFFLPPWTLLSMLICTILANLSSGTFGRSSLVTYSVHEYPGSGPSIYPGFVLSFLNNLQLCLRIKISPHFQIGRGS